MRTLFHLGMAVLFAASLSAVGCTDSETKPPEPGKPNVENGKTGKENGETGKEKPASKEKGDCEQPK